MAAVTLAIALVTASVHLVALLLAFRLVSKVVRDRLEDLRGRSGGISGRQKTQNFCHFFQKRVSRYKTGRLGGGPGRTRTCDQAVMSRRL